MMLLRVNGEYLDFQGDFEMEKQVKLFEEIDSNAGDFSYAFEVPNTAKNRSIFRLFSITQATKIIYQNVPAQAISNGIVIYDGFIKVERENDFLFECSFFSGNNNWFGIIKGELIDLQISDFDQDISVENIEDSWTNREGLIYPVINTGAMGSRGTRTWMVEDFHPFIYVKTIVKRIFTEAGLKLQGELLSDWRYNYLITSNNDASVPQEEIKKRSVYVGKEADQAATGSDVAVVFELTNDPYEVGEIDNWDEANNRFVADVEMIVDVTINYTTEGGGVLFMVTKLFRNTDQLAIAIHAGDGDRTMSLQDVHLDAGDYLEFTMALDGNITRGTFRVTPTRIYRAFARSFIPKVSRQDFLNTIFSMFNVVTHYDKTTKTVYADLFKNIPSKPEIDISSYIEPSSVQIDYSEFIADFGRFNMFVYDESDQPGIEKYNKSNAIPYAAAQVDSLNDNTEFQADVVELDAVPVIEDTENPLGSFLPHIEFVELQPGESVEGDSVTEVSGMPEFQAAGFFVGELVRISESTEPSYNGDWYVSVADADSFRVIGLSYNGNASFIATKLLHEQITNDDQLFMLAVPSVGVSDFSNHGDIYLEDTFKSSVATAYFYKPLQGLPIDSLKESLSWGPINILNAHQKTLIDDYWKPFVDILRDPVKVFVDVRLKETLFNTINFKQPLRLRTSKFDAQFYGNRITGYKNRYMPCQFEIIKLS